MRVSVLFMLSVLDQACQTGGPGNVSK